VIAHARTGALYSILDVLLFAVHAHCCTRTDAAAVACSAQSLLNLSAAMPANVSSQSVHVDLHTDTSSYIAAYVAETAINRQPAEQHLAVTGSTASHWFLSATKLTQALLSIQRVV
jgi:hypothetical protein